MHASDRIAEDGAKADEIRGQLTDAEKWLVDAKAALAAAQAKSQPAATPARDSGPDVTAASASPAVAAASRR